MQKLLMIVVALVLLTPSTSFASGRDELEAALRAFNRAKVEMAIKHVKLAEVGYTSKRKPGSRATIYLGLSYYMMTGHRLAKQARIFGADKELLAIAKLLIAHGYDPSKDPYRLEEEDCSVDEEWLRDDIKKQVSNEDVMTELLDGEGGVPPLFPRKERYEPACAPSLPERLGNGFEDFFRD